MDDLSAGGAQRARLANAPKGELHKYSRPSQPYARLEASPDDTARRHLGAAMAAGQTREAMRPVAVAVPQKVGSGIGRMVAAVCVLAGLGGGAWITYDSLSGSDSVAASSIEVEPVQIATYTASTAPAATGNRPVTSEPQQVDDVIAPDLIAPVVLAAAPAVPVPASEGTIFSDLTKIEPVVFSSVIEPVNLPTAPAEEPALIVFQKVPKRIDELTPSGVQQPDLPALDQFVVEFSLPELIARPSPVLQHDTPVVLASVSADVLPFISSGIPELPKIVVPAQTEEPLPLVITTYEAKPSESILSASLFAPRNSLRPIVSPPNRRAIAARQIARRKARASSRGQIGQAIQAEVVRSSQVALGQPLPRPEIIAPKRTRLQRLFKGWGSQKVTTIEKFAEENND